MKTTQVVYTACRLTQAGLIALFLLSSAHADVNKYKRPDSDKKRISANEQQCQEGAANGQLHNRFTVASWNILKGKRIGWSKVLQDLDSDNTLFMIQEATKQERLTDQFQKAKYWNFAPGYKSSKMQSGVLTSARVRPTMYCHFQHEEPWLGTAKATLITRYPIDSADGELMVINIHAINFTVGVEAFSYQIADAVNIALAHEGPMILGGDFNTWSEKRILALNKLTRQLNLREVPFDPEHVKKFKGHALDRVFFRGLELENKKIRQVTSSDHNMLIADFKVIPISTNKETVHAVY